MNQPKKITIVSPVFNEEAALPIFYNRLKKVIDGLGSQYECGILFTNNRSTDGTLEYIRSIQKTDESVHVITMSRNFGYTASVLCGITYAQGDAVVVIDADCEDPPELIPEFIAEWNHGFDIVYGLRQNRQEPWFTKMGRKLFYRVTRMIADHEFIADMAEFSLFTSRVRDQVVKVQTAHPFIRSELAYVGFNRKGIPYTREKRAAGQSYLNLFQLFYRAFAFIITASTFPIRLAGYAGVAITIFDFLALVFQIAGIELIELKTIALINMTYLVYAATFVPIYIARIYRNGMMRPNFIIDQTLSTVPGQHADHTS